MVELSAKEKEDVRQKLVDIYRAYISDDLTDEQKKQAIEISGKYTMASGLFFDEATGLAIKELARIRFGNLPKAEAETILSKLDGK